MKKLSALLIIVFFSQHSFAQNQDTDDGRIFKKFKVDLSLGYASPTSSTPGYQYNGGVLFSIEPKFAIIDPLAIGVRFEEAVIAHVNADNNNNNSNSSSGNANLSILFTTDYYFTNTHFRPFIGGGAGIYSVANIDSTTLNSNSNNLTFNQEFGFMVRAGFEFRHLRIGAEYNIISNNNSYIGIKIGGCIGGGRKRY